MSDLYFAERPQDALRREWKFIDPDTGRVMDCCANDWRNRQKGQFAKPTRSPGSIRIGYFDQYGLRLFGNVPDRGDKIGAELIREHASVLCLEIFHERVPLGLHDRTLHLAFHQC